MTYFGTHARQLSHLASSHLTVNPCGDPSAPFSAFARSNFNARSVFLRQRDGRLGSALTGFIGTPLLPLRKWRHWRFQKQEASYRASDFAFRARRRELGASQPRGEFRQFPPPVRVWRSVARERATPFAHPIAAPAATKAPAALFRRSPGAFFPNNKLAPSCRAGGAVFSEHAHAGSPGRVSSAPGHPAVQKHGSSRAVVLGALRQTASFVQVPRSMRGRPVPQSARNRGADDRLSDVFVFSELVVAVFPVSHRCAPSKVASRPGLHQ